jgi:hypothetical protein
MINFMLHQFRKIILEMPDLFIPMYIPESHGASAVSVQVHQKVRKTHTIIPDFHELITTLAQHRINDGYGMVNIHDHQAFHDAELRRSDGPACPVFLPEGQYKRA